MLAASEAAGSNLVSRYRVSIDIGGTFTDFVVHDQEAGRAFTGKVLSTPRNP
ncbi:MAG: hydantoinase/oxoprolinase N-terminal domain-containing protein, partial [Pseudonocardiaceae bacterium]